MIPVCRRGLACVCAARSHRLTRKGRSLHAMPSKTRNPVVCVCAILAWTFTATSRCATFRALLSLCSMQLSSNASGHCRAESLYTVHVWMLYPVVRLQLRTIIGKIAASSRL